MPGRGNPWRKGGHVDDTIRSEDIEQGTIKEEDLDPALTTKVNQGGHAIQDEGTPITQQTKMNFIGSGVTAAFGSEDTTTVTIPGGGGGGSWTKLKDEAMTGTEHTVTFSPAIDLTAADIASLKFVFYIELVAGETPEYTINGVATGTNYSIRGVTTFSGTIQTLNIQGNSDGWNMGDSYPTTEGFAVDTLELYHVAGIGGARKFPVGLFTSTNPAGNLYVYGSIIYEGQESSITSIRVKMQGTSFNAGSRVVVYKLAR